MAIQTVTFMRQNVDFIYNMFDIAETQIEALCRAIEKDFAVYCQQWTPWAYIEYIFSKIGIARETMFMTDVSNLLINDGWGNVHCPVGER